MTLRVVEPKARLSAGLFIRSASALPLIHVPSHGNRQRWRLLRPAETVGAGEAMVME